MRVMYQFGDEPKEKWYTRIVELPSYPNGKGGNLWLSFFNDRSFELILRIMVRRILTEIGRARLKNFQGEIHDNKTS